MKLGTVGFPTRCKRQLSTKLWDHEDSWSKEHLTKAIYKVLDGSFVINCYDLTWVKSTLFLFQIYVLWCNGCNLAEVLPFERTWKYLFFFLCPDLDLKCVPSLHLDNFLCLNLDKFFSVYKPRPKFFPSKFSNFSDIWFNLNSISRTAMSTLEFFKLAVGHVGKIHKILGKKKFLNQ